MSQRLTRKEIKRDEVAEWFGGVGDFFRTHGKMLVVAGVALVVLVVGGVGGFLWLSSRATQANALLTRAMKVYAAPVVATDAKPDDSDNPSFTDEATRSAKAKELFAQLKSGFHFAHAADVADVYLGRIALADGDPDGARKLWQEFVDEHGKHLLANEIRVNLFALDRQQGKAADVASALEAMLTKAPDERPLPGDVILDELAETYEVLGRADDARSTYARLVEEYPQSAFAAEARQKAGPAAQAQAQALAGLGS
jgi:tetratricopeptide (TPR) repeat protein